MTMTNTMQVRTLTLGENGTYDLGADILPDLIDGGEAPQDLETALSWLADLGYRQEDGFAGWGTVVKHHETGDLLSITID